jgi:phosphoribosyl 1,2-cyclic phosphodiesterase
MRIWLLSSGSCGNAAIVEGDGGRLLIDAGLGPRVMATRMRMLGGELFPRGIDAIVVTHQHGDHIAHLEPIARTVGAPIYLHQGITAPRARARYNVRSYVAGEAFEVGPFEVSTLVVPHDAPQVALRVRVGALGFGLVTDLGRAPAELTPFLGACDEAIVEANYCPDMMRAGPYPPHLQDRVTGNYGHLANGQTSALAASLQGTKLRRMWLGHLSQVNNTPALALASVRASAPELDVEVLLHGEPKVIDVLPGRTTAAHLSPKAKQIGLPFP